MPEPIRWDLEWKYFPLCALGRQPDLFAQVVDDTLLTPEGRLIDEPLRSLSMELRDVEVYASILRAIANGYHESGEIKSFIMDGFAGLSISSYLEKLRGMRLITDVRAIDADPKARYIRYTISDPLVRFWNLFVQPNRLMIEQGQGRDVFENTIKRQLSDYMVLGFEDICRDFVRQRAPEIFDTDTQSVGQMWGPGYNIPIAGRLVDRSPVFGACEWHMRAVGEAGAEYLMQQVRMTNFGPESAQALGDKTPLPYYALFSRSGFTPEVRQRARQSDFLKLVTPADIVRPVAA